MGELIKIGEDLGGVNIMCDPTQVSEVDGHWTSFPRDTDAGRFATLNAMTGDAVKSIDVINGTIEMANLVMHGVELRGGEGGELVPAIRTIVIAEDGTLFSFVSVGIFKAMKRLVKEFGPPPWIPPILGTVKTTPAAQGHGLTLTKLRRKGE